MKIEIMEQSRYFYEQMITTMQQLFNKLNQKLNHMNEQHQNEYVYIHIFIY